MNLKYLNLKEPISNQTDVALKPTKQLIQTEFKDKNMVYSPLSIHIVPSLIASLNPSSHSHTTRNFPNSTPSIATTHLSRGCPEDFKADTYKYDPRSFSMFWLLPDARDWLPALVERVRSELGFLDHHLNGCRRVGVGKFLIPKFKMSSGFEASSAMKKLGRCDLMAIFHEAVIEVDENGTTAAAATCARRYFGDGEVSKGPFGIA
ncbi:serpin-Z2A-like [Rosa rugosa]|uniref:serpin-Z2A-like n=1 Tax=Rosa rugosa TaxID=74645 RepID=UPI002B401BDA|nr:serpin-Z2A-like [Rosa rugosa]